jgi:glycerol-3-phosphate dehydrogenase (NAD(P)+)
LAKGRNSENAKKDIGMVVEGSFTCVAALELGKKYQIPLPITEGIYAIIYEQLDPKKAVHALLTRAIKEEHL